MIFTVIIFVLIRSFCIFFWKFFDSTRKHQAIMISTQMKQQQTTVSVKSTTSTKTWYVCKGFFGNVDQHARWELNWKMNSKLSKTFGGIFETPQFKFPLSKTKEDKWLLVCLYRTAFLLSGQLHRLAILFCKWRKKCLIYLETEMQRWCWAIVSLQYNSTLLLPLDS